MLALGNLTAKQKAACAERCWSVFFEDGKNHTLVISEGLREPADKELITVLNHLPPTVHKEYYRQLVEARNELYRHYGLGGIKIKTISGKQVFLKDGFHCSLFRNIEVASGRKTEAAELTCFNPERRFLFILGSSDGLSLKNLQELSNCMQKFLNNNF